MLPVKQIPDSMGKIWSVFQNKFMKMELELLSSLRVYKQITIHERVCHLLNDLSVQINQLIKAHTNELQRSLDVLKNNNIQLIETVTNELYNNASLAIDAFYSNITLSSASYRSSAKETCRFIIRSGGKLRKYKDQEAPRINQSIKSNGERYISAIRGNVNGSTEIIQKQQLIKQQESKENSLQSSISYYRTWLKSLEFRRKAINDDAERLLKINNASIVRGTNFIHNYSDSLSLLWLRSQDKRCISTNSVHDRL